MLDLTSPRIMGVLNVTPDSFSDGGLFNALDRAVPQALRMLEDGATIIDVGGESTRPGAKPVSVQEELDRVCPVVEALKAEIDVYISVDTSSPEVMREVIALDVGMINDVRAFQREGVVDVIRNSNVELCLMHMQGQPKTMQEQPSYEDVCAEVIGFLSARIERLQALGVSKERMLVDPGFGFGKALEHNLGLLKNLNRLEVLACPVLVGLSRKTMIGAVLDAAVEDRVIGSVAAALIAVNNGARIVRVHDVKETSDALRVWRAVNAC
jgi:dihydropteroate synthase